VILICKDFVDDPVTSFFLW